MTLRDWFLVPAFLIVCVLPSLMLGCAADRAALPVIEPPAVTPKPPAVVTPAKPGETDTERSLREARDTVSRLTGDLATWQQRVTALQEDKKREDREKVLAYLRTCLLWMTGLALLGGVACVVLAIVSPVAKSTLARLGIACACVLVVCAGMLWCLPWLPVLGVAALVSLLIAGLVLGVILFVGWFRRHMHAAVSMADGFQQVTAAAVEVIPDKVIDLDRESRARQYIERARDEGDKLLAAARTLRDKREPTKKPQATEPANV